MKKLIFFSLLFILFSCKEKKIKNPILYNYKIQIEYFNEYANLDTIYINLTEFPKDSINLKLKYYKAYNKQEMNDYCLIADLGDNEKFLAYSVKNFKLLEKIKIKELKY